MKKVNFTKMVASGNDFVVIDARKSLEIKSMGKLAKKICARKISVGADGLILLEKSKIADFKMRIFNSDGSEPEMCGNGARCISLFALINKIAAKKMKFETVAGMIEAQVDSKKKQVKLRMSDPKNHLSKLTIKIDGKEYTCDFIDTGVPHVVHFVRDINKIDVQMIGSGIRHHSLFSPSGTNVNFVQKQTKSTILVRTYERGVESETFACGTGSTASALISAMHYKMKSPIDVITHGGDILKIYFSYKSSTGIVEKVFLEGHAEILFSSEIKI